MTMWRPELEVGVGEPAYQAIVRALEQDVAEGRLAAGTRLPTHRKLARELGVAVGTVTRAYAEASARGLVHGEVGRGTFVGLRGGERYGAEQRGPWAGYRYDLAVTWPLYGQDPDLAGALRRLAGRADAGRLLRYSPHGGHGRHREAGAAWAAKYGLATDPERVLVCAGVQHALSVVLSIVAEPGDVIATESFTYAGLRALAQAARVRLAGVRMDGEGMVPEAFEAVCRQRRPKVLYTVPTIQNPTTSVLSGSRREALAEIAERYGVVVLEDDVHRLLHEAPPVALQGLLPRRSYAVASLSKVVTGGLRVAYLVVPAGAEDRAKQAIWATTWMASPLGAELASLWIEDGTAEATVERKREEARARQAIARDVLGGYPYATQPTAYHLWLELPSGWQPAAFALAAERRGLAITPAAAFAVSRARLPAAIRVSLSGAETRAELRAGLELLAGLLSEPAGAPVGTSAAL